MFDKIMSWLYERVAGSQIMFDLWADYAEDAGILTSALDTEFECGYVDDEVLNAIPDARRRRRRRRRRCRSRR